MPGTRGQVSNKIQEHYADRSVNDWVSEWMSRPRLDVWASIWCEILNRQCKYFWIVTLTKKKQIRSRKIDAALRFSKVWWNPLYNKTAIYFGWYRLYNKSKLSLDLYNIFRAAAWCDCVDLYINFDCGGGYPLRSLLQCS